MLTRRDIFERVKQVGIIPAIRPADPDEAIQAARAIRLGGIPVLEISLSVPQAVQAISAVSAGLGSEILLGAGSVLDGDGVRAAHSAGAQFIVTSGFSADTVRAARELDIPILAGALTPSEVQIAIASGADAIKIFPCFAAGGPRYIRSLRSQYPQAELIASGGVGLDNCSDYLRAGACAIGVGGEIGDAASMAAGDQRLFIERARRFRKAVCESRALFSGARLQVHH